MLGSTVDAKYLGGIARKRASASVLAYTEHESKDLHEHTSMPKSLPQKLANTTHSKNTTCTKKLVKHTADTRRQEQCKGESTQPPPPPPAPSPCYSTLAQGGSLLFSLNNSADRVLCIFLSYGYLDCRFQNPSLTTGGPWGPTGANGCWPPLAPVGARLSFPFSFSFPLLVPFPFPSYIMLLSYKYMGCWSQNQ